MLENEGRSCQTADQMLLSGFQKDICGVWKSFSHSNPTSSKVSDLNPGRGPLVSQAAVPGAEMEEGTLFFSGQVRHSSGTERRKWLFEGYTAKIQEVARCLCSQVSLSVWEG